MRAWHAQKTHSAHAPLISLRKIVDGTTQSTIEGNVNLMTF